MGFLCSPGSGCICGERLVPDFNLRASCKFQGVTRPAVAVPVETRKRCIYVAIIPGSRIGFTVTPPGCRKFQYKPGSSFLQVDAAFRHVDIKRVFRQFLFLASVEAPEEGKDLDESLRAILEIIHIKEQGK